MVQDLSDLNSLKNLKNRFLSADSADFADYTDLLDFKIILKTIGVVLLDPQITQITQIRAGCPLNSSLFAPVKYTPL